MADVKIDVEQVNSIASSLKTKGNKILLLYKENCESALQMSAECLQLSGLDPDTLFKSLEQIYSKVNDRLIDLADFLTNTIVSEYNSLNTAVVKSFNEEFANEVSHILGLTNSSGVGSSKSLKQIDSNSNNSESLRHAVNNSKKTNRSVSGGSRRIINIPR